MKISENPLFFLQKKLATFLLRAIRDEVESMKHFNLRLPDGRRLVCRLSSSSRNRNLRLRISPEGELMVSAPLRLGVPRIMEAIAGNNDWITERLKRFQEERDRLAAGLTPPRMIALPALEETLQVAYRQTSSRSTVARTDQPGRIIVHGTAGDGQRCNAALRRWLARRAKEALGPWLESLAAETGLGYSRLTIRNQRTRWGSCSAAGAISLNCKLLFLAPDLVRYVLLHELCHSREHNHTARYWSLLRQHEPDAAEMHRRMRDAWRQIPAWAHPVRERSPILRPC